MAAKVANKKTINRSFHFLGCSWPFCIVKWPLMYQRIAKIPNYSFFLFGPRSTGKTTWLKSELPDAFWVNLLRDEDLLQYRGDMSLFSRRVEAFKGKWVVVDEVQKLPSILNDIHDLMTRFPGRFTFALSGSSARKLKRSGVNLLAGRVIEKRFFPLVREELGADFDLERILKLGTLPLALTTPEEIATQVLFAYVNTYLKEEIQQEALVEDVGSFHRFLFISGLLNGTIPNISSVSRDTGTARKTVERYFDILVDTLIAVRLPSWKPRAKVRECSKPKFYLFDTGVVRALQNKLGTPINPAERGLLLETYLIHEVRTYLQQLPNPGQLFYWRSGTGAEVDLIWSLGETHIGIEIKASQKWRREYGKALRDLRSKGTLTQAFGIYCGEYPEKDGGIDVLPVELFLEKLYRREIFKI